MPKLRNDNKGDSNLGSLDCESGILPLSYRAPQCSLIYIFCNTSAKLSEFHIHDDLHIHISRRPNRHIISPGYGLMLFEITNLDLVALLLSISLNTHTLYTTVKVHSAVDYKYMQL